MVLGVGIRLLVDLIRFVPITEFQTNSGRSLSRLLWLLLCNRQNKSLSKHLDECAFEHVPIVPVLFILRLSVHQSAGETHSDNRNVVRAVEKFREIKFSLCVTDDNGFKKGIAPERTLFRKNPIHRVCFSTRGEHVLNYCIMLCGSWHSSIVKEKKNKYYELSWRKRGFRKRNLFFQHN